MNIVLTGGSGFIGSHLSKELLKNGENRLIVVDNLLTGNLDNIQDLLDHENATFIQHDVQDHIEIDEKIDYVFHLASAASPVAYTENPVNTLKAGSLGTINTLGLARKHGAEYFLASTSEVYGDPLVTPQNEEYWGNVNPNGERSMYDEAKRFAEAATATYARSYGIKTKIIRIFNTYGPNMQLNDGRVVTNLIVQALNDEDLTIYGDGSQTRSFSYVSDTVAGIIAMMESNHYEVFNIGNPYEMTVKELAETILKLTNSKSEIIYKPLPNDDPQQRRPDISKAKEKLNWEPKVHLETGLNTTIEWIKKELSK
ncbi:SDR family oxidoreductase [Acidimicrobiia bacterium]|jgi:dTDP-glucose 4,6-dehydratase|nr:SDR family oxidoreductase [Acidimicrobiia bacterium]MDA9197694.1 SDR family oxidoreductase [Acidimicrobiia bacterium]MDB3891145.1 SDR family oxidoreductase [Acidimicrobiia bacterium]MDB3980571.1 SDR family oxidoreductase [Acidimicrobiia bacterium]MDB3983652.1 SDR family oxidoreductase [Acidimicrobiia bacterium]